MKRMNKLSNMESCEEIDSKSIINKLLNMNEAEEKDLEEKVPAIISDIDHDSLLGFNMDSVFEGEMIQKKSKEEKHKSILLEDSQTEKVDNINKIQEYQEILDKLVEITKDKEMVSLLKKSLTNDQSSALGTLAKTVTILPDIRLSPRSFSDAKEKENETKSIESTSSLHTKEDNKVSGPSKVLQTTSVKYELKEQSKDRSEKKRGSIKPPSASLHPSTQIKLKPSEENKRIDEVEEELISDEVDIRIDGKPSDESSLLSLSNAIAIKEDYLPNIQNIEVMPSQEIKEVPSSKIGTLKTDKKGKDQKIKNKKQQESKVISKTHMLEIRTLNKLLKYFK